MSSYLSNSTLLRVFFLEKGDLGFWGIQFPQLCFSINWKLNSVSMVIGFRAQIFGFGFAIVGLGFRLWCCRLSAFWLASVSILGCDKCQALLGFLNWLWPVNDQPCVLPQGRNRLRQWWEFRGLEIGRWLRFCVLISSRSVWFGSLISTLNLRAKSALSLPWRVPIMNTDKSALPNLSTLNLFSRGWKPCMWISSWCVRDIELVYKLFFFIFFLLNLSIIR